MLELWVWRHPKPLGAVHGGVGRCIGRTDLAVDPRKAKRLAHRIRAAARRHELPRSVSVSPLARSREVGRWLRRWGWDCAVDARLLELNFGDWDGRPWSDIAWAEVEVWRGDLLNARPAGGESVAELALRVRQVLAGAVGASAAEPVWLLVGHAGWINVARLLAAQGPSFDPAPWPVAPRYGEPTRIRFGHTNSG